MPHNNNNNIKNKSIEWYKENLKKLGLDSKSVNKSYLAKKYHEYERRLIRAQAYVRGWMERRNYADLLAQDSKKILTTVNDSTLVGEPLTSLKSHELYILKEHNQYYGFDLGEIWEWACKNKHGTNPYTTYAIPDVCVHQINRLYQRRTNTTNTTTTTPATTTTPTPATPTTDTINYSAKLTDFFIRIESMGCYANMEGYKDFNNAQLISFFKSLYNDYDSIKTIITADQYQSVLSTPLIDVKYRILSVLEGLLECPRSQQEDRALIFTLHLSKCLSPNNDELEHYYLNNINYLIQHIIQQNTYSDTFEENYDDDDDIDEILDDLNGIIISDE